jgi:molybdopterin/thiamine biosynthesis adenylyltransferase
VLRLNFLTEEEKERYQRQIVLKSIGNEGQKRLKKSHVAIVGIGGLGSISALYLASMGVGFLRIIDKDSVDVSNLQRQILYTTHDLASPKVEVAKRRLEAMNPNCKVEPFSISIGPNTVKEIIEGVDLIIDGLDNFSTRFIINKACVQRNIPYVFGGVLGTIGNASTFISSNDDSPCLECIFSKVQDEELETTETVGVHPSIIGIISCVQISEAVRILTGKNPFLKGKLLFGDLETLDFQTIEIVKNPSCPTCSKKRT